MKCKFCGKKVVTKLYWDKDRDYHYSCQRKASRENDISKAPDVIWSMSAFRRKRTLEPIDFTNPTEVRYC